MNEWKRKKKKKKEKKERRTWKKRKGKKRKIEKMWIGFFWSKFSSNFDSKIWYNLFKGFFMGKNGIDSSKKFKSPNLYDKLK